MQKKESKEEKHKRRKNEKKKKLYSKLMNYSLYKFQAQFTYYK